MLPVDIISIDFMCAFGKVPHDILLEILCRRGILDAQLRWLKSYLSLRRKHVRVHETLPSAYDITSEVVQESSIGITLFVLFFYELLWSLETLSLLVFADDLKFIVHLHIHLPVAVQKDLERVGVWL